MNRQFFAQLNENHVVINVHCVTAEFMAENPERYTGTWVETFFNTDGKIYAGIDYVYDHNTENFIAPIIEPIEPDDEQ